MSARGSARLEQRESTRQDAQKGRPARPQLKHGDRSVPLGCVEGDGRLRTKLATFSASCYRNFALTRSKIRHAASPEDVVVLSIRRSGLTDAS